ncbi:MAG: 4-hydroxybutyrate--acetyl-CoA CoA transferase [Clostridia bacterium]|nr:4-hydroxybutyrate--acetyl-CoA CoA transferase [Clostridia bacterium]
MDYQSEYQKKLTTLEGAYSMLKDGDLFYAGTATAEPVTFLRHLHEMHGKLHNLTMHINLALANVPVYDPKYADLLTVQSSFFARFLTPLQRAGMSTYMPAHLRNIGLDPEYRYKNVTKQRVNVYVLAVSPMDKHGYFTSSAYACYHRTWMDYADKVIVEVNENAPRTFGDTYVHISEVDAIIHSEDNKIIYMPIKEPDEYDKAIGKQIADLIKDGDNIQLGIGGIPTACARELAVRRDLGVHTEMLNDGLVYLAKAGAITNKKKNYFPDKILTTFSMGTKDVYDFIDDNPNVLHLDVAYTNNPKVFSRNDRVISVNSCLQIDLMGQCASEAIGTNQISGVGGQTETAVGAKESLDGKSIIALHSTRLLKQKDGTKKMVSNITPVHPAGTVISLMRNDVDFVCTEYGMAALRGASLKERAQSLINIAHPDFRDELLEGAKKWYLI